MIPKISIITVTYNAADTLRPTLESVSQQTYGDYEHLIIDGASKDGTLELATSYNEGKMRILSEHDHGLYDAMNKGLREARGEYLLFLNAGDSLASEDSLKRYAELTGEGTDVVYGDTLLVDRERHVVGKRHLDVPEHLSYKSLKAGMLVCHQAFLVRKAITVPYDLSYRFSADYDWEINCLKNTDPSRCRKLARPEIHYLKEGLTTANHKASLKERFAIMRKHFGLPVTLWRHAGFIPRAIMRKLGK